MLEPRFVNDGNGYKNLNDAKCQGQQQQKKNPIFLGQAWWEKQWKMLKL
jgi:hypothetical protein